MAGNYKLGRVSLHGLKIAIEQPRNTYRTGVDQKTGKRWVSRMAAHYGYISGTTGADGDGVDCFIGPVPQSEQVFIVNQFVGGRFDEHKVMLGFLEADDAKRAYLDSYERGWKGLQSLIPLSISQLKWWITNGNMRRPVAAKQLPFEGFDNMEQKTAWGGDALPIGKTLDQVLYDLRRADSSDGLLFDSASIADIIEDADELMALDAMVVPFAKLGRKLEQLRGIMDRSGGAAKPVAMQITEPFKLRGVANVAAIVELADGQTVSIYFHNPDVTPGKMAPSDEVISWRWLLNKRDITIAVAPERGVDLNPREVSRRIMKLAEKNSAAFQRANAKRTETMGRIDGLKTEISALETELKDAQHELEVAKVEAEAKPFDKISPEDQAINDSILAVGDALIEKGWERIGGKFGPLYKDVDGVKFKVIGGKAAGSDDPSTMQLFRIDNPDSLVHVNSYLLPGDSESTALSIDNAAKPVEKEVIDPTSPEGYAKIMADEALQLENQDGLDSFFGGRIVDVRNALRELGWFGDEQTFTKGGFRFSYDVAAVGAGKNVVGLKYEVYDGDNAVVFSQQDDLTKTPEQISGEIDAVVPAAPIVPELTEQEKQERQASAFDAVLNVLASEYGWRLESIGVKTAKKMFDGVGPKGTMVTPNGERQITVWNRRGQFLLACLGDTEIITVEVPAEGGDYPVLAAEINSAVELFVAGERQKRSAEDEERKRPSKMDALPALKVLRGFMSSAQINTFGNAMRGEEAQYFVEKAVEMANVVKTMPKTYEQDGMGDQAVVYLHYFVGSADWYITERDMDKEQLQAFGLADLGQGFPELGYISIDEITKSGAELDLHWSPKTIAEIKGSEDVQPKPNPDPIPVPDPIPDPIPDPAPPAIDPAKVSDRALLQGVADGTTDPMTVNLESLEAVYERNADDAELAALFERAVEVILAAEDKATAGA